MNKTTPRTDPVYSMPKPTDNAFLQETALNAVKQIAGHAGDAMRYMVETILTREDPRISMDFNDVPPRSGKTKWQQRLEEMQERQRQMKAAKFPPGGVVGPKGGEFIENPKFTEPKEGELTIHYYQGTERALILKSPICVNCGKHSNLHEAPYFKCPK